MTINLADKKALKKLAKDLNNGKYYLDEISNTEIYKPSGSKLYIIVDNTNNKNIFSNCNLNLIVIAFNKHVQDCIKQRQKSLQSSRVQK